jgi:vanillate O-demethylase monooxygenase subunit
MRWRPAAILELSTGMDPLEGGSAQSIHLPSLHYLTPETESSTHYFVAASRNWQRDDPEEGAYIGACLMKAFIEEDEPMVRAVESLMGTTDLFSLRPAILQTDISAVQARRLLAKKIEEELAGNVVAC